MPRQGEWCSALEMEHAVLGIGRLLLSSGWPEGAEP